MRDREVIKGMTDPRLERDWRTGVTPTKDSDISARARAFKSMLGQATFHTMALEGSQDAPEQQEASEQALRAIRGNVVRGGHSLMAFDMLVTDNVTLEKRKAKEEAEDARLVEETFSERQAFRGETPIVANVNFGNHAKRDPFGL